MEGERPPPTDPTLRHHMLGEMTPGHSFNYQQRRETEKVPLKWILMDFTLSVMRYNLEPNQWLSLSPTTSVVCSGFPNKCFVLITKIRVAISNKKKIGDGKCWSSFEICGIAKITSGQERGRLLSTVLSNKAEKYLFKKLNMKRTTKLFVARGILLTAALSLYSYISHEEVLLSVLSNPLLYLSRLISPRVPDGDRLGGLSYGVREQRANTRHPFTPPRRPAIYLYHPSYERPLGEVVQKWMSGNAC